jgi:hypothetical protein
MSLHVLWGPARGRPRATHPTLGYASLRASLARPTVICLALLCAVLARTAAAAEGPPERVWEVNGIRLERSQVDRLAADMARRTVAAVERKVEGIALRPGQRDAMLEIYRDVSLGVFERVVDVVDRSDLSDAEKESSVRELVLEGQRQSHERLTSVLDARQLPLYARWEEEQVKAYKSARWDRRRRGRR